MELCWWGAKGMMNMPEDPESSKKKTMSKGSAPATGQERVLSSLCPSNARLVEFFSRFPRRKRKKDAREEEKCRRFESSMSSSPQGLLAAVVESPTEGSDKREEKEKTFRKHCRNSPLFIPRDLKHRRLDAQRAQLETQGSTPW